MCLQLGASLFLNFPPASHQIGSSRTFLNSFIPNISFPWSLLNTMHSNSDRPLTQAAQAKSLEVLTTETSITKYQPIQPHSLCHFNLKTTRFNSSFKMLHILIAEWKVFNYCMENIYIYIRNTLLGSEMLVILLCMMC